MTVTSTTPQWVMETMPSRRNMGDMILLPTRNVLIINGAQQGSQGWGAVFANPTLNPVAYLPSAAAGSRFLTYTASAIPRVYHSTANLLPDGRILVAGSNSHQYYTYTGTFPTELRVESFSPPYLQSQYTSSKPGWVAWPNTVAYGQAFTITIALVTAPTATVEVNLISCPFTEGSLLKFHTVTIETSSPTQFGDFIFPHELANLNQIPNNHILLTSRDTYSAKCSGKAHGQSQLILLS